MNHQADYFLRTPRLGFRFTHEEFYPPTGLMHPSYLLERGLAADALRPASE